MFFTLGAGRTADTPEKNSFQAVAASANSAGPRVKPVPPPPRPLARLALPAALAVLAAGWAGAGCPSPARAPAPARVSATRDWPQAAGPRGSWQVDAPDAPTRWSVARGENVLWRAPLPSGGQGGIAVGGDRLFLTTYEPYDGGPKEITAVLGHAIDRRSGKRLWSVRLAGGDRPSQMASGFGDATSWTPITDGEHVWFFDSTGEMGCWDLAGREIWRRTFRGQPRKYPFNRQLEPMMVDDTILTVEMLAPGEPRYRADRDDWSYLRGLDKRTGRTRFVAEDATTFYNTPVVGRLPDGRPAVLHGRGGPHDVPERPIGLSMTSLAPGEEGKTVWRFDAPAVAGAPVDGVSYQALYTMVWDRRHAYWFRNAPEATHLVLDAATGLLVREQSLEHGVDVRRWDPDRRAYRLEAGVDVRALADPSYPLGPGEVLHVFPGWHANMVAAGRHYFLASTNHRRNKYAPPGHSGPAHCLGRVDVETGKVEYLELPVGVDRRPGAPDQAIFGRTLHTRPLDARGRELAMDRRSSDDGWESAAFFPTPIVLGDHLYLSVMLGLTYVIDVRATVLDERALLSVNDLGPLGETWSMSGPSYGGGVLYHRSLKELVAIGQRP
jgi:hypothetical protein